MRTADEIIHTVVSALASADGVAIAELAYTLADYVEPSLLETLVSGPDNGELTFQVPGHEVTVTATGAVFVDGTRFREDDTPPDTVERTGRHGYSEQLQLQRFFDNLPCTVYRSRNEPGWPIEFISENCRALTGYDPNAFVLGGVEFGFDLIHPDDRCRVAEAVRESVRSEEPFSIVYRLRTADGTEKWVMENGIGLVDEGDPITFVGAIVDVTDLKQRVDLPSDLRA